MSVGGTASIWGLIFAALALGLFLARFNVFALVVASAVSAALFVFYFMQDSTLVHAILLSLATAFVVQIGYLFGQFLQKPPG
jgi:4-hydroxybenzoate polyprenyltransferase